jgi:hypothetical protein
MENTNQPQVTEQLAINAEEGQVEALLHAIQYHQAPIKDFLEAVEPAVAFQFCAWFIGLLAAQQPSVMKDFAEALKVGVQTGGVLLDQYHKEHPSQPRDTENFRVIFPQFMDPNQALLHLPTSGSVN